MILLTSKELYIIMYPPLEVSWQRGRPRFKISKEQLENLRSLSFSWTSIADVLLVSIYRRRTEYGLLDEAHSAIHDREFEFVRHTLVQYYWTSLY